MASFPSGQKPASRRNKRNRMAPQHSHSDRANRLPAGQDMAARENGKGPRGPAPGTSGCKKVGRLGGQKRRRWRKPVPLLDMRPSTHLVAVLDQLPHSIRGLQQRQQLVLGRRRGAGRPPVWVLRLQQRRGGSPTRLGAASAARQQRPVTQASPPPRDASWMFQRAPAAQGSSAARACASWHAPPWPPAHSRRHSEAPLRGKAAQADEP